MNSRRWQGRALVKRWMKFNAVGAMGICVQMLGVYFFGDVLDANSLWATAMAVEAAVLHNFFWHEHVTWADRRAARRQDKVGRLIVFNITTGVVSIGGNLFFVLLLMREARASLLTANLFAVAACSLANFIVNDRIVFHTRVRESARAASQGTFFTLFLRRRNSTP